MENINKKDRYTKLVHDFISFVDLNEEKLDDSTKTGLAFLVFDCIESLMSYEISTDEVSKLCFTEDLSEDKDYKFWFDFFDVFCC